MLKDVRSIILGDEVGRGDRIIIELCEVWCVGTWALAKATSCPGLSSDCEPLSVPRFKCKKQKASQF